MAIKAVVFDIGGVCVGSPLHAINIYERRLGLPHNYLNYMIARHKSPSPMNRLEMGDIPEVGPAFFELFEQHLNDPEGYDAFFTSSFCPEGAVKGTPQKVEGEKLFRLMLDATTEPNVQLLPEIRKLKQSGKYKVWALTNNFPVKSKTDDLIHSLFHRVIGSIDVKMRKPDPRIYEHLIKELNLDPHEIVFLDDIGANLKAASKLGIHTIQVDFRTTQAAIKKLHVLLETGGVRAQL